MGLRREVEEIAGKVDFFAFDPQPRMLTGPSTSIRGALGTAVLMIIILAYAVASLVRWFTVPPSVSLTQTAIVEEEIDLPLTCFALPYLDDPSYWRYSLARQTKNASNGRTTLSVPLNVTLVGRGAAAKMCVSDDNAYLRSFCNPGDCDSIKFKLFTCDCPIAPPPTSAQVGGGGSGGSGPCVGYNVSKSILDTNYLSATFESDIGVVLLETPPKIIWSSRYLVYFQLHQRVRQPDYLERFESSSYYHAEYDTNAYSLQYFWGSGVVPPHEILEMEFRLGPTVFHTNDNPQTSLDLIGSWGAFFGVISGVLRLYFRRHNVTTFYKRFPNWARVDEWFRAEPCVADISMPLCEITTGPAVAEEHYRIRSGLAP